MLQAVCVPLLNFVDKRLSPVLVAALNNTRAVALERFGLAKRQPRS